MDSDTVKNLQLLVTTKSITQSIKSLNFSRTKNDCVQYKEYQIDGDGLQRSISLFSSSFDTVTH